jgi:hypothetical protein
MADTSSAEVTVSPAKGHRFAPGHKHFPRKPKDRTIMPNAIATWVKLALDPLAELIKIYRTGVVSDPAGGRKHEVDVRTRCKLLREIVTFVYTKAPTLVSAQIAQEVRTLDVTKLMQDPAMAEAAENLAIAMAEYESRADVPKTYEYEHVSTLANKGDLKS